MTDDRLPKSYGPGASAGEWARGDRARRVGDPFGPRAGVQGGRDAGQAQRENLVRRGHAGTAVRSDRAAVTTSSTTITSGGGSSSSSRGGGSNRRGIGSSGSAKGCEAAR